jgi:hypothetical protein
MKQDTLWTFVFKDEGSLIYLLCVTVKEMLLCFLSKYLIDNTNDNLLFNI